MREKKRSAASWSNNWSFMKILKISKTIEQAFPQVNSVIEKSENVGLVVASKSKNTQALLRKFPNVEESLAFFNYEHCLKRYRNLQTTALRL